MQYLQYQLLNNLALGFKGLYNAVFKWTLFSLQGEYFHAKKQKLDKQFKDEVAHSLTEDRLV